MFLVILFIVSSLVFVYEKYTFAKISRKGLMDYKIYAFQVSKKWMKVDDSFEMLPGEKVIIPISPAYMWHFKKGFEDESFWGYKFSGAVLDIMVTNRRIIIGRILGFNLSRFGFPIFTDEVFGMENYWHPGCKKILGKESDSIYYGRYQGIITGDKKTSHNKRLRSITYSEDDLLGPYVKIERDSEYQTMRDLYLFHPKAKGIHGIFSAHLEEKKSKG
jgi:hypothetical protein